MTPELRIARLPAQTLSVKLRGPDVRRIRPQTNMRLLDDPEEELCDFVAQFALAAATGMFSYKSGLLGPVTARATRLPKAAAPDGADWSLDLANVDFEALGLLGEMIAVRAFESGFVLTENAGILPPVPLEDIAYPDCAKPGEFEMDYNRPMKSRGPRAVRLEFHNPLPDEALDEVLAALDAWGNLLMQGAYADVSAGGNVGAFAEEAALEDALTVGLNMPHVAGMDELMFSPVLNLARRIHALTAPVARLIIE